MFLFPSDWSKNIKEPFQIQYLAFSFVPSFASREHLHIESSPCKKMHLHSLLMFWAALLSQRLRSAQYVNPLHVRLVTNTCHSTTHGCAVITEQHGEHGITGSVEWRSYILDIREIVVRFPIEARDFILLLTVQTGSGSTNSMANATSLGWNSRGTTLPA